jgi:hypothetical protein
VRLRTPSPALLLVLLAVLAGATLRLWNLPGQVMGGDELHAVRAALQRPPGGILFTYQVSDNCIPLTLFDRLVLDAGWPLTEMVVRSPVLVAGLALLVLGPWWAWRRLGAGPAVVLAWLLALSPALVFYSRIARSYMPVALLGFAAVAAIDAWQRRGGWNLAAAYVACATAAVWFHLGAGPLVVAPLLAALPWTLREGRRRAWALVGIAAATALALLALLLPAHETLPLVAGKRGGGALSAAAAGETAAWLAGVRWSWWLAVPFWAVVVAGGVRLARRDLRLAALLAVTTAGQLAGILALAPEGLQNPIILARYLVPALPLALALAADALGRAWPGSWRRAQPVAVAGLLAALFAAGPFTDPTLRRSSFAHAVTLLRFTDERPALPRQGALGVYAWLADAGPGIVVELPWHPVWRFDRAVGLYQAVHRRPVIVTVFGGPLADRRLAFRNMVPADAESLLRSRGRWLVVHRSLPAEEERFGPLPLDGRVRYQLRIAGPDAARRLRAAWGPPDHRDERTWCWDLDRVRRQRAPPRR